MMIIYRRRKPSRLPVGRLQGGFTLLEAIVALALFAGISGALLGWINTNLYGIERIEAAQQRNQYELNALALIQSVNPMGQPDGEIVNGELTVRWQATLLEPETDSLNRFGNPGLYKVGLYDLRVQVLAQNRFITAFNLHQVGYRKVRNAFGS